MVKSMGKKPWDTDFYGSAGGAIQDPTPFPGAAAQAG